MKIRILDSAKKDIIKGFQFYEFQAQGIGNYFLDSLFSEIDSLVSQAGIHPIKFRRYYFKQTRKFPFAIYYSIQDEIIFIHAVLDCRRNPDDLIKRLGKE